MLHRLRAAGLHPVCAQGVHKQGKVVGYFGWKWREREEDSKPEMHEAIRRSKGEAVCGFVCLCGIHTTGLREGLG